MHMVVVDSRCRSGTGPRRARSGSNRRESGLRHPAPCSTRCETRPARASRHREGIPWCSPSPLSLCPARSARTAFVGHAQSRRQARPTAKITSTSMTAAKGSIWITSVGMLNPRPEAPWSATARLPKSSAPISTQSGRPRASIASTMPMKPAPLVMYGMKTPAPTLAMKAPPRPAIAPVNSTAADRRAITGPPATSSAAGLSPAACSVRPSSSDGRARPAPRPSPAPGRRRGGAKTAPARSPACRPGQGYGHASGAGRRG